MTQLSPTSGPHVIGMAVTAAHLASEHIVAANPTRSVAVALIAYDQGGCFSGAAHWAAWIGPMLGSIFACLFYGLHSKLGNSVVQVEPQ